MKKNPNYVRVGTLILLTRRARQMTGKALGSKAKGLSKGYLSGIERGNVPPPAFKMAQSVAKALRLPEDFFPILCQLVKLPEPALKRPRIAEEIEALFAACGEPPKPPVADATPEAPKE
jgi:transcriptional regulator with XRE-family HTH domain